MLDYETLEKDTLTMLDDIKLLKYGCLPDDKRVLVLDHITFLSEMIREQCRSAMTIINTKPSS